MKKVSLARLAIKGLQGIPADQRRAIMAKIDTYAADPASLTNNVKRLRGSQHMRLRVGAYRVIFVVEGDTLVVTAVGHRRDIYD